MLNSISGSTKVAKERRLSRVKDTMNLIYFFDNHEVTYLRKHTASVGNPGEKRRPAFPTVECPPQLFKQPEDKYP